MPKKASRVSHSTSKRNVQVSSIFERILVECWLQKAVVILKRHLKELINILKDVSRQPSTHLPVLRSIFLVLGTSDFVAAGWTWWDSSFSESLPPELSIETRVSIPTWSHPKTDRERVAKAFAFNGAFGGCAIDFLGSGESGSSSGDSSNSSLSLFNVRFTLNLQDWKRSAMS